MHDLVFSVQEFLKLVPGIAIFPLSFYLAWKKIGSSISCSVKWQSSRISANRISNVVITNNKDKPVTIFEIIGIYENHIYFIIEEFKSPMILKSLETTSITTSHYSNLDLPDGNWEIEPSHANKFQIYLSTPDGLIKCKLKIDPVYQKNKMLDEYIFASKMTRTFNGIAYNNKAAYAVTFPSGQSTKTVIIDTSGFIVGAEELGCNLISVANMASAESVSSFLQQRLGHHQFMVHKLEL